MRRRGARLSSLNSTVKGLFHIRERSELTTQRDLTWFLPNQTCKVWRGKNQVLAQKLDKVSNLRFSTAVARMQHMWPFTGRKRERAVDPSVLERLAALENKVNTIDVEWSEWYDKYRRLYARLAKRVHDDEQKPEPQNGGEPPTTRLGARTTNPLAAALLRGPTLPGG